jgi:hypothetical protein
MITAPLLSILLLQHGIVNTPPIPNNLANAFAPPTEYANDFGDFQSVMKFDDGRAVKTKRDWSARRTEIRRRWHQSLGAWPQLMTEQRLTVLKTESRPDFTLQTVRYRWTPTEATEGYLLIPPGKGPHPAIVTVYYEPETAIGQGKPNRDFAIQLAKRGFVTLSIGTKEASNKGHYGLYYPSLNEATVQPLSMLACAAANSWYVLANHPQVDSTRIGIVGHSFGGKWAMFASCLFDKFACAAWSDPGIVFDTRGSVNYWEPWYLGYHGQPWRKRGLVTDDNPARGLYPTLIANSHDLHELHVLMAPRPFLVSGGSEDGRHRWTALNHSIAVNRLLGHKNRVAMTNRPDHSPNPESNDQIYSFFEMWLKPAASQDL